MAMLGRMLRRGWWCALALGLLLTTGSARAEEKISEEAKGYFRNGVELIQSSPPNYQDAYYQFKLAYEKSGSWKVLGNLGLCALKMERDGEALEHYTNYLKGGGNDIDPEERKALERDSLLISGNSAVVNLTAATPDADLIDARAGSSVPPQTYKFAGTNLTLRLRAGTHTLTATSSDGKQEKWEVVLSPGRTVDHRFDFAAAAAAAPAVAPGPSSTAAVQPTPVGSQPGPPTSEEPRKGSPLRLVGFIAAGVGGAALVGGVVTGLMAKSKDKKATDACTDKVCPTSVEGDFDSAKSLATVTNVLFIGGGVLAAAGVGLIIVGGGKSTGENPKTATSAPRLRLTPVAGADGAGLFATGSF
jgi:hypothetical protein